MRPRDQGIETAEVIVYYDYKLNRQGDSDQKSYESPQGYQSVYPV